jgi:hypothetical protein
VGTRVQRLDRNINGRTYHIEVAQVQRERWRAHVVNDFGGPTACMPFYDATADSAVDRLSGWLERLRGATNAQAVS